MICYSYSTFTYTSLRLSHIQQIMYTIMLFTRYSLIKIVEIVENIIWFYTKGNCPVCTLFEIYPPSTDPNAAYVRLIIDSFVNAHMKLLSIFRKYHIRLR